MSGAGEGKTILPIEWTNQHGCGHGDLNCNIVLQYKCQSTSITEAHRIMRNGMCEAWAHAMFKTLTFVLNLFFIIWDDV
jgi:hypothetical protein